MKSTGLVKGAIWVTSKHMLGLLMFFSQSSISRGPEAISTAKNHQSIDKLFMPGAKTCLKAFIIFLYNLENFSWLILISIE